MPFMIFYRLGGHSENPSSREQDIDSNEMLTWLTDNTRNDIPMGEPIDVASPETPERNEQATLIVEDYATKTTPHKYQRRTSLRDNIFDTRDFCELSKKLSTTPTARLCDDSTQLSDSEGWTKRRSDREVVPLRRKQQPQYHRKKPRDHTDDNEIKRKQDEAREVLSEELDRIKKLHSSDYIKCVNDKFSYPFVRNMFTKFLDSRYLSKE